VATFLVADPDPAISAHVLSMLVGSGHQAFSVASETLNSSRRTMRAIRQTSADALVIGVQTQAQTARAWILASMLRRQIPHLKLLLLLANQALVQQAAPPPTILFDAVLERPPDAAALAAALAALWPPAGP